VFVYFILVASWASRGVAFKLFFLEEWGEKESKAKTKSYHGLFLFQNNKERRGMIVSEWLKEKVT